MPGQRRFPYFGLKRFCRPATVAVAGVAVALLAVHPAAAKKKDEVFTPRMAISLPNGQKIASFDIGWTDPLTGGYYLADRTNAVVDAVVMKTGQVAVQFKANFAGAGPTPDTSGPNGVLTIDNVKANTYQLWVGDYGTGSNGGTGGLLKVIDLTDGNLLATIATGGTKRADELCYDPKDGLVMIANDAEALPPTGPGPYLSLISTSGSNQYKVVGQIFMNGKSPAPLATNGIEQCQYSSRTGMFYVNIPEVNGPGDDTNPGAVLVISPKTMSIVKTYNIDHTLCEGPQGMVLGPDDQILLGCNDPLKNVPSTIIISARTGKTIAVLPNEDGADEVWYNPGDGHYFLGNSGGANPQHLGIVDALTGSGDNSPVTGLPGKGGAHSVAADPITLKVFVPIPSTAGAGACSAVGGDDSVGCILVYKAKASKHEVEGE
ncbi:MAG: YncE family protein [Stellaceae bacterium]